MDKTSRDMSFVILMVVCCLVAGFNTPVLAEDSAPSSHFVFDDTFDGDIIVNEVRIPADGEAMYTYYETLGWRGTAAGYAGLQAHPRAHNFIFSIWDHKEHTSPIRAVHHGPGTETKGFGGEGTGLKSWNFDLGWSTGTWYTLVSRAWSVEDHTHFGFWVRAGDTGEWTHLVTMDVAVKDAKFQGGTDAFIEDWLNTGKDRRTTNLRNGWKRKLDGKWFPFGSGRYSVNHWDLEKGKRSYNFRTSWNGGVRPEKNGTYYFMESGGEETKPETENPSRHKIPRKAKSPSFDAIVIEQAKVSTAGEGQRKIDWTTSSKSLPQFSFEISVEEPATDGSTSWSTVAKQTSPHTRSATIDLGPLKLPATSSIRLECVDIFGNKSPGKVLSTSPE